MGGTWGLKWGVGGGRRKRGQRTKVDGFGSGSQGGGLGHTTVMDKEKGKALEGKRRGNGLGMMLFGVDWGALGWVGMQWAPWGRCSLGKLCGVLACTGVHWDALEGHGHERGGPGPSRRTQGTHLAIVKATSFLWRDHEMSLVTGVSPVLVKVGGDQTAPHFPHWCTQLQHLPQHIQFHHCHQSRPGEGEQKVGQDWPLWGWGGHRPPGTWLSPALSRGCQGIWGHHCRVKGNGLRGKTGKKTLGISRGVGGGSISQFVPVQPGLGLDQFSPVWPSSA